MPPERKHADVQSFGTTTAEILQLHAWVVRCLVGLAERASRLTQERNAAVLDVLAAAYAAAGRFDRAIATACAALAALPPSQRELAAAIEHRLDLDTKGLPYQRPD